MCSKPSQLCSSTSHKFIYRMQCLFNYLDLWDLFIYIFIFAQLFCAKNIEEKTIYIKSFILFHILYCIVHQKWIEANKLSMATASYGFPAC